MIRFQCVRGRSCQRSKSLVVEIEVDEGFEPGDPGERPDLVVEDAQEIVRIRADRLGEDVEAAGADDEVRNRRKGRDLVRHRPHRRAWGDGDAQPRHGRESEAVRIGDRDDAHRPRSDHSGETLAYERKRDGQLPCHPLQGHPAIDVQFDEDRAVEVVELDRLGGRLALGVLPTGSLPSRLLVVEAKVRKDLGLADARRRRNLALDGRQELVRVPADDLHEELEAPGGDDDVSRRRPAGQPARDLRGRTAAVEMNAHERHRAVPEQLRVGDGRDLDDPGRTELLHALADGLLRDAELCCHAEVRTAAVGLKHADDRPIERRTSRLRASTAWTWHHAAAGPCRPDLPSRSLRTQAYGPHPTGGSCRGGTRYSSGAGSSLANCVSTLFIILETLLS